MPTPGCVVVRDRQMPQVLSPLRSFKNPSWLSLAHISKFRRYLKCFKVTTLYPTHHNQLHLHSLAEDKTLPVLRMAASFVKLPKSLIREPSSIKAFWILKYDVPLRIQHLMKSLPWIIYQLYYLIFSFSYIPIAFCLYIYIAFILFWF